MKAVERGELLDLAAYERIRDHFRNRVIALKKLRRVQLGQHMSLVFENHDTVLLQVQEMLRTERISDERAIAHELTTYNELLPATGCLSATMFVEYDDAAERREMLERFASLRDQIFLRIGKRDVQARFATHFGEEMDRLPAVNYLTFDLGPDAADTLRDPGHRVSLLSAHPDYSVESELGLATREELARDLE